MKISSNHCSVFLPLALAALSTTSTAQVRLFDLEGSSGSFGADVAALGDTNGDGREEFLVCDPSVPTGGTVTVFDGASGTALFTVSDWVGSSFAVAPAGDVNNDGIPDFVAGSGSSYSLREAVVYSGADGAELHRFSAVASNSFGSAVAGAGDIDGDGYERSPMSTWARGSSRQETSMATGSPTSRVTRTTATSSPSRASSRSSPERPAAS